MAVGTKPVQISESLYHRLERLAEISHRPLETVVEQTLNASVPPLPDDIPEEMQADLLALETMGDEELWEVARSVITTAQQDQHRLLLEKNRLGTISKSEQEQLTQLRDAADQLMLRKAYAYVLLKWRGHHLPTLAELEAQE